jgi:hypothetical protein
MPRLRTGMCPLSTRACRPHADSLEEAVCKELAGMRLLERLSLRELFELQTAVC